MPLMTFACPACHKVLKSATAIAAGTKVQCPTCGTAFTMTAQDAAPITPPGNGGALPPPSPGGKRRSRAVLIGVVVLLLLVAALGVGAYFLFFDHAGPAHRDVDPLAYVPPGAEFVAGADFPTLLDDSMLGPTIEVGIRAKAVGDFLDRCQKETGLSNRELLGHALLCGKLDVLEAALPSNVLGRSPQPTPATLILKTGRSFDARKVARAAEGAKLHEAHGKAYYEVSVGTMRTLYMPTDRIIVLSAQPASELEALFTTDGNSPALSAEGVALVRDVEAHPFWAVVPIGPSVRTRLEGASAANKDQAEVKALLDSLAQAKGLAVWADADAERLRFGINIPCTDADAAARTVAHVESAARKQKDELKAIEIAFLFMPKTGKAYRELTGSMKISSDGATARGSAELSRRAIMDAAEELQKNQPGGLLGGIPGLGPPGTGPKPGKGATGKSK